MGVRLRLNERLLDAAIGLAAVIIAMLIIVALFLFATVAYGEDLSGQPEDGWSTQMHRPARPPRP